jgi:hypothetical protein
MNTCLKKNNLFKWKYQGAKLFSAAVDLFVAIYKSIFLPVAFKNRNLSLVDPLNGSHSSQFFFPTLQFISLFLSLSLSLSHTFEGKKYD